MNQKPVDRELFDVAYAQLNQQQKKAVDTIDGPVMVVAGPGTGKTQILTLRIANILLKTDTAPDSILALTFTDSGAKAMRERLRRYIGSEAYRVSIYTFHAFTETLISRYPDAYARVVGGRPASELEKISLIEAILSGGKFKYLRPHGNPTYYVSHIMRSIGQLKQEYITPDSFIEIIAQQEEELNGMEKIHEKGAHKGKVKGDYSKKEKAIAKNYELLHIYREYEALLSDSSLYDFDDMIVETVKALQSDEEMLRDLQEQFQYILADEHQDVNGSQNKILELLSSFHDSPNIFAVGDEKQAIYRFQGASLENFLYFTEQFVGTEVISLTENYRSGQTILDAAHSLVEVEEDGQLKTLRIPLNAAAVSNAVLEQRSFVHQAVEDTWLTAAVHGEITRGVDASEIAVIVRTNREVELVSAMLRKSGIRVTASADGDILRHSITRSVQALLDAVVIEKSEAALFATLHGAYWGIETNDLLRVCGARSYDTSLWSIVSSPEKLVELQVKDSKPFLKVVEVIEEARKREVVESPHRVLEYMLQASGFFTHVMQFDALEGVRVLRRLYDEVEELVKRDGVGTLREVSAMFATLQSYNLKLNAPYIETDASSVQVMTAHKSKGLEFDTVFVPHLTDGAWSGKGKKRYFDIPLVAHAADEKSEFIEDERRLLYVAMTRAKTALHLSYSELSTDGKEVVAARLLSDIDEGLIETVDTAAESAAFDPLASLTNPLQPPLIDAALLQHTLLQRGFSATSLNNYLRSPWDYLYRNVLRVPEVQPVHMQFGTVVHNTLEYTTKQHTKTGVFPTDSQIKTRFEQQLKKLPINTEEYTSLHERGFTALMTYIGALKSTLPEKTVEELNIRVHLETGIEALPELLLTGKLDRLDIGDDGRAVRVVDYKTGKPKSRNVIEGNTKDSDGAYKRQLVFYALLLSLYDDDRYRCTEGVLSFVEPTEKGDIKEESFVVTQEEIDDLKKTIIAAARSISSGAFLSEPCDEKQSDYCHFVSLLRKG